MQTKISIDSERKDPRTFHTEEEIDKLKKELQKLLQIKKEYEQMLSREKESVIKSLKNHGFLEDEIHQLMNDERELEEKIQECEQKINNANAENCMSKCRFERLNVSRAEKVALHKAIERYKTNYKNNNDNSNGFEPNACNNDSFGYSEGTESQLKIFDIIDSETSSKENKIQSCEKVKNIVGLLNEVTIVQNNHTLLAAYLPRNLLKQLNNQLQQLWMSMSSEMAKLARQTDFQSLKTKVLVIKSLSSLDELYNDVIDTKKLLEAIEGHRYTEVASEMLNLKQHAVDNPQIEKVLEDLQSLLSCLLKALMKSAFLEVLVLGENEIEEAKHFVFTYVDQVTQDYISKKERPTESVIGKWVQKILCTIDAAIKNKNYGKKIEEKLNELVKKYKSITFSNSQYNSYSSNPPKALHAKLSKGMENTSTYNYKGTWTKIEENIFKKFRDQFATAREQATYSNPRESDRCLRLVRDL
ncbi:chromosome segregation protein SMC [Reticulomyxa filosa]|uniref:Chromosome segregation protein SMC n=1 Tax=Reticulomyxa filosa TaxID=46433 RepID=X6LV39_RETFI|nr:chromosome segregation protein SMC [Reticulomyxa filosa]|eukprot:ETO05793.1 chromosome segregation protein SMC [Reticulomyxa filosa]